MKRAQHEVVDVLRSLTVRTVEVQVDVIRAWVRALGYCTSRLFLSIKHCASDRATRCRITVLVTALGLGIVGLGSLPTEPVGPPEERVEGEPVYIDRLIGDDNGDGRIDEDESGWDCRVMGNGICG